MNKVLRYDKFRSWNDTKVTKQLVLQRIPIYAVQKSVIICTDPDPSIIMSKKFCDFFMTFFVTN
jgi:hypothetical protein